MKRIISLVVTFCLLCSVCIAEEVTTTQDNYMTMEQAVDYALKHNSTIVDLEKTVKDQKELYDDAKDEYRKWKNKVRSGGYSFEDENEYLTCWGYMMKISELQYNSFLSGREGAKQKIEYSVKNMIYSIFELEDNIELLNKSILKQENDVQIAEVKFSLNMITKNDLESVKSTLETSRLQLESIKKSLETLKISLKKIMGFNITEELLIKRPEYVERELTVEDLEKTIEDSLETNNSVLSAKLQYQQKENQYILATKTSFMLRDDKKKAKDDYSDAEFRLNNDINYIKENLRILYNQVKDKESEVKIAKEELNRARTQYEQAKVMFKVGLISKNSYLGSELSVMNAENSYKSKVKETTLLNDRFNIAIKVGDVVGNM